MKIGNPANYPTYDEVEAAVKSEMFGTENPGFCLSCGEAVDGCEPDARGYECEACGEPTVYGAAEVLLMGCYRPSRMKSGG